MRVPHASATVVIVTPRRRSRPRRPSVDLSVGRRDGRREPGDLVRVVGERGRPLGWAFWSSASQIALRMSQRRRDVRRSDALARPRSRRPSRYRRTLGIDATACRLVNGEADRLPGLIVDRYGDRARRADAVAGHGPPACRARRAAGASSCSRAASSRATIRRCGGSRGSTSRSRSSSARCRRRRGARRPDPLPGRRPARAEDRAVPRPARESRRRRPATRAAARSTRSPTTADSRCRWRARCDSVLALDSSAAAVAATPGNATRNGLANVEVREANVFDELRELEIAGSGSTPSCSTRRRSPRTRPRSSARRRRLQGNQPARAQAARAGRPSDDLQLLVQRRRGACSRTSCSQAALDARATVALVEKRAAGARPSGPARRAGDALPEVPGAQKADVDGSGVPRFRGAGVLTGFYRLSHAPAPEPERANPRNLRNRWNLGTSIPNHC